MTTWPPLCPKCKKGTRRRMVGNSIRKGLGQTIYDANGLMEPIPVDVLIGDFICLECECEFYGDFTEDQNAIGNEGKCAVCRNMGP